MSVAKYVAQFKTARRIGTPLIAIQTPDPQAAIDQLVKESPATTPAIIWDTCRGWRPGNAAAIDVIKQTLDEVDPSVTAPPTEMLIEWAPKLPKPAVLYLVNAHRYLNDGSAQGAAFVQALWNLRDVFKMNLRSAVVLGPQITLPPELSGDVLLLDEPRPDDEALGVIIDRVVTEVDGQITPDERGRAIDALRGLAAFSAEQATAMSLDLKARRVLLDVLWDRKEKMINQTPGLRVWKGGTTLDDVGGCENVKRALRLRFAGKMPPRIVLWWDEIEKMFAGATSGTGDSSGVTQRLLGTILTKMQEWIDKGGSGMLFVGPPGAAKSMVAKAAGATFGVPTLAVDAGAIMDSLVGSTEARTRALMDVVDAMADGRVLVIMTCNKQIALPPELKRRLTGGTFYFDLPDADEQAVIWAKGRVKYEIDEREPLPDCRGWTGAEIMTACAMRWQMDVPLVESPQFIVPVVKSAAEDIALLRKQADGKFLSASKPGAYTLRTPESEPATPEKRRRAVAQENV